jgi:hypothetical protein
LKHHARGELGWFAESRKSALPYTAPRASYDPQLCSLIQWREYLCESFCDTAAWLYSGVRRHGEFTLRGRYRKRRAEWFHETFGNGEISI